MLTLGVLVVDEKKEKKKFNVKNTHRGRGYINIRMIRR